MWSHISALFIQEETMLRKALIICSVLALLLVIVVGTAMAAGDAANGKTLWAAKNCKSCHGTNGEGKNYLPLAGSTKTAADWVKEVRTPAALMPAYSTTQVSDQDLADMLAYMQTLTKPASFTPITYTPAATDLPGKVLYNQKGCVTCHGADPSAFLKSRFTDKSRTLVAADVIKQLRTPAANMPMFSAAQVSDADATQIAAYYNSVLAAAAAAPAAATAVPAAAAPTALPKSGDQLPVGLLALAGIGLLALGGSFLLFARRSA
jgi:mono/diheme cytochrome c family protein